MRYITATTQNFSENLSKSINQSIEEGKGLFIYGNTGTGKTYTLHALAKGRGNVENFVELLIQFRDFMHKGFYSEKIIELTNQEYLFIDDIGSEKTSDFVVEFLYLIVNKRYENLKRTVFTTNLSLEAFSEKYSDRVLSRIVEMCVLVELSGEDQRLK